MYRVYVHDYTYNSDGTINNIDTTMICDSSIQELSIINPVVTLEVNTAGQFSFTLPSSHPYRDTIKRLTSVIEAIKDGVSIFRGFCSGDSNDLWNNRAITCEGELSYLNDSILRPGRYRNYTVEQLLASYLNQHNSQVEVHKRFTLGYVTVQDPNNSIYCYTNMNSAMLEIKEDLIDDLGGYLRIRRVDDINYLDYIRLQDFAIASQTIELGVNLVNYQSNINDLDLATRCIPLGATLEEQEIQGLDTRLTIKGQAVTSTHLHTNDDYLQASSSVIGNLGIITKTITFDGVNDPTILMQKGDKYLSQNQFENLVIEISAVDLSMISNDIDAFRLMDKIRVISDKHGLDDYFPLTKMVLHLNNPETDMYTLGTKSKVQNTLTAKTTEASEATRKVVDSINKPAWLAQAQTNALNMLLDETQDGYVVLEYDQNNEYIEAINVCNAKTIDASTSRWRWSRNGFGYMERNSTSASWSTLKVAMTSDGSINADRILTGTLRSRQIYNGSNGEFEVTSAGVCTAKAINITDGDIELARDSAMFPTHKISISGRVPQTYSDAHAKLLAGGVMEIRQASNYTYIRGRDSEFGNDVTINGNLKVYGSNKDRVIRTKHYGEVPLSAYETARPTFADEGHGVLNDEGMCYIYLDDTFIETIDTIHRYRVFLTKYGQGDIWVEEVQSTFFITKGTPGLEFDWKVDCTQKNHNQSYLNRIDYGIPEDISYNNLADQYLNAYEREVLEV